MLEPLEPRRDVALEALGLRMNERTTVRAGLVESARLGWEPRDGDDYQSFEALVALLAHPAARALSELELGLPCSNDVGASLQLEEDAFGSQEAFVAWLTICAPPSLRSS